MEYYNKIADGYDELHREEQKNKLKIIKANLKINKQDKLLDVGCGSGLSSNFNCSVYGIDPSEELLKRATNIEHKKVAVAESIPFPDSFFDIVISVSALHHVKDIDKALSEIKRVGKERFAFSILKKAKSFNKITTKIREQFTITKEIDEGKDLVLIE